MTSRHSCTRFVVDHITEDVPVCDAVSRVATAMVSELKVHAAANIVELYMQTLVVIVGLNDTETPRHSNSWGPVILIKPLAYPA
ncbi:hypothetical protein TNCV_924181 [Trichonephila clavipes]|nr:hypothetical protein TNCV_924181 [Trichonephila clavipes]